MRVNGRSLLAKMCNFECQYWPKWYIEEKYRVVIPMVQTQRPHGQIENPAAARVLTGIKQKGLLGMDDNVA
jgi:hypothetical protein